MMPWWLWMILGLVVAGGFTAFTGAPYVPSKRRDIKQAFTDLYPLTARDTLVDIGSGDGVVLRMARQFGAEAIGYEINPVLVLISRVLSRHDDSVQVKLANFWQEKLPDTTTVVYTFGDSRDIVKMYQLVEKESRRLRRSIAFISYGFSVPGKRYEKKVGAHYLYMV